MHILSFILLAKVLTLHNVRSVRNVHWDDGNVYSSLIYKGILSISKSFIGACMHVWL